MADITSAIMNELEIMKMSNEAKSLSGSSLGKGVLPESQSNKNWILIIVGCAIGGTVVLLAMFGICYCFSVSKRPKTSQQGHPWLTLPFYGNSQTIMKMSMTSQKSQTASCVSLTLTNIGRLFTFQEIIDATNKFDESSFFASVNSGGFMEELLRMGLGWLLREETLDQSRALQNSELRLKCSQSFATATLSPLLDIGMNDQRWSLCTSTGPMGLFGATCMALISHHSHGSRGLRSALGLQGGSTTSTLVKTTNIHLDENFVAKVADFGL